MLERQEYQTRSVYSSNFYDCNKSRMTITIFCILFSLFVIKKFIPHIGCALLILFFIIIKIIPFSIWNSFLPYENKRMNIF